MDSAEMWSGVDAEDVREVLGWALASAGVDARLVDGRATGWRTPCRDCADQARPPQGACATCEGTGSVLHSGGEVPDLEGVDEDARLAVARAVLAGTPYEVMHQVDVLNALIAQQEHGAARTRQEVVSYANEQWLPSHALAARVSTWKYDPDLDVIGMGKPQ
ncbi:hypothetical protein [Nocardiopsis synnemataformans]|uniref:hypothetical protein n=1 Tax=Nocardiopsis synnemataformans TaxID=61305 RepID=UPI003EC01EA4